MNDLPVLKARLEIVRTEFSRVIREASYRKFGESKAAPIGSHVHSWDDAYGWGAKHLSDGIGLLQKAIRDHYEIRKGPTEPEIQELRLLLPGIVDQWISECCRIPGGLSGGNHKGLRQFLDKMSKRLLKLRIGVALADLMATGRRQVEHPDPSAPSTDGQLRVQGGSTSTPHDPATAQRPAEAKTANTFRWDGDGWHVEFHGIVKHFPPRTGIAFLHSLISTPGKQWRSMELTSAVGKAQTAGMARTDGLEVRELLDAGEIIDDKYLRNAKVEIRELDERIVEANQRGDAETAGRLTEEKDEVARIVADAHGLGGRKRKAEDPHEQARKMVQMGVKRSMDTIRNKLPSLHAHLKKSIRTGLFIIYEPDQPITWITE